VRSLKIMALYRIRPPMVSPPDHKHTVTVGGRMLTEYVAVKLPRADAGWAKAAKAAVPTRMMICL
jgi:hypothetical protein